MRSYGSTSVTATYTGPLPGTLCYDRSCRQAAPGYYTAPGGSVVRTWTNTSSQSCPSGYTGSIVVTEQWRTVKYWTPREGGLSSRGTLVFTSATRDERVGGQGSTDCTWERNDRPESQGREYVYIINADSVPPVIARFRDRDEAVYYLGEDTVRYMEEATIELGGQTYPMMGWQPTGFANASACNVLACSEIQQQRAQETAKQWLRSSTPSRKRGRP